MISKIKTHHNARNSIQYNNKEGKGRLIMESHEMDDDSPKTKIKFFNDVLALREKSKKNLIMHIAISAHKDDKMTDDSWIEVVTKYIEKMDFHDDGKKTKIDPMDLVYLVYRHEDTDNDHIHLILSRVTGTGGIINHFQSATKSQNVLREIEKEMGLFEVEQTKILSKSYNKNLRMQKNRLEGLQSYNKDELDEVNRKIEIEETKNKINEIATLQAFRNRREQKDFPDFLRRLAENEIFLQINYSLKKKGDTEKTFKGVSFTTKNIDVKGSKIGLGGKEMENLFPEFFREITQEKADLVNNKEFLKGERQEIQEKEEIQTKKSKGLGFGL